MSRGASLAPLAAAPPFAERLDPLLGHWRLAALSTRHGGGIERPLGAAPSGAICYEEDGRMSVQLCKDPAAPAEGGMPAFTAYCGRYTLDRTAATVTHHIEAASLPMLAGTEQVRQYRRNGDRLVLSAATARGETILEWVRSQMVHTAADTAPPGFETLETPGVFPGRAGRFYVKDRAGPAPIVGTRIGQGQCNSEGFAHGGYLLAFADFAISMMICGITINLSTDFLRPARLGDWIEARIVTRKRSAELIFADAMATCEGRDILRISGLFKPFGKSA